MNNIQLEPVQLKQKKIPKIIYWFQQNLDQGVKAEIINGLNPFGIRIKIETDFVKAKKEVTYENEFEYLLISTFKPTNHNPDIPADLVVVPQMFVSSVHEQFIQMKKPIQFKVIIFNEVTPILENLKSQYNEIVLITADPSELINFITLFNPSKSLESIHEEEKKGISQVRQEIIKIKNPLLYSLDVRRYPRECTLLWIDATSGKPENLEKLEFLKSCFSNYKFEVFEDLELGFERLKELRDGVDIILTSGSLGKPLMERIDSLYDEINHLHVIIFCGNVQFHSQWSQEYVLVKKVTDKFEEVLHFLMYYSVDSSRSRFCNRFYGNDEFALGTIPNLFKNSENMIQIILEYLTKTQSLKDSCEQILGTIRRSTVEQLNNYFTQFYSKQSLAKEIELSSNLEGCLLANFATDSFFNLEIQRRLIELGKDPRKGIFDWIEIASAARYIVLLLQEWDKALQYIPGEEKAEFYYSAKLSEETLSKVQNKSEVDSVLFPGFLSVTKRIENVLRGFTGNAIFQLCFPNMSKRSPKRIAPFSKFSHEKEYIIPLGTLFNIKSVVFNPKGKFYIITLEVSSIQASLESLLKENIQDTKFQNPISKNLTIIEQIQEDNKLTFKTLPRFTKAIFQTHEYLNQAVMYASNYFSKEKELQYFSKNPNFPFMAQQKYQLQYFEKPFSLYSLYMRELIEHGEKFYLAKKNSFAISPILRIATEFYLAPERKKFRESKIFLPITNEEAESIKTTDVWGLIPMLGFSKEEKAKQIMKEKNFPMLLEIEIGELDEDAIFPINVHKHYEYGVVLPIHSNISLRNISHSKLVVTYKGAIDESMRMGLINFKKEEGNTQ